MCQFPRMMFRPDCRRDMQRCAVTGQILCAHVRGRGAYTCHLAPSINMSVNPADTYIYCIVYTQCIVYINLICREKIPTKSAVEMLVCGTVYCMIHPCSNIPDHTISRGGILLCCQLQSTFREVGSAPPPHPPTKCRTIFVQLIDDADPTVPEVGSSNHVCSVEHTVLHICSVHSVEHTGLSTA